MPIATLASWCEEATSWPLPGHGATEDRFDRLSSLAQTDLVLGRLVEAHADAVAICAELGSRPVGTGERWGVWAAGPPDSLRSVPGAGGWEIDGTKSWCSGATLLSHALVDASTADGQRLFAVALSDPGLVANPPSWVGPGMARADTRTMVFEKVGATPVGCADEYLSRPGFWAGAIGVAACWHGGTVGVAGALLDRARSSRDPHLLAHLGAVHVALGENRSVLSHAASRLDSHLDADVALVARSLRSTVERNAVEVIDRVGRALGPAPLAHDAVYAALVADLTVYVRQHHAERDLEQIGRDVAGMDDPWRI